MGRLRKTDDVMTTANTVELNEAEKLLVQHFHHSVCAGVTLYEGYEFWRKVLSDNIA